MGVRDRGDFQTPPVLAAQVVGAVLAGASPRSILEPTCGAGSLLAAAVARAPDATAVGVDIDTDHLAACRAALGDRARLIESDFFALDWASLLAPLPDPLLVIGNPPWVTSATLGALGASNAPARSPALVDTTAGGLAALTGRSNFDISEWMLWHLWPLLTSRRATLAMLVKTAVARKVLARAWRGGLGPTSAELHRFDAAASFRASVDACLLVCRFEASTAAASCAVRDGIGGPTVASFGLIGGELVADIASYTRHRGLLASGAGGWRWRSGVKHDCSPVLELRRDGTGLRNGLGDRVDVEPAVLYPLFKSAELYRGAAPSRTLLLPQRTPGEDPARLAAEAPRAWAYLERHGARFDARKSSIYRKRPRFSVFGIGAYSFAPWKVAVSGFYKELAFRAIGPHEGRPVLFDDTCYFVPCDDRDHAERVLEILHSAPVQALLRSMVFWDAKRPITARLLQRLDLDRLAREATATAATLPA